MAFIELASSPTTHARGGALGVCVIASALPSSPSKQTMALLLLHGRRPPHVIVTDLLRSYGATMKVMGNIDKQETGRWLNNRAENSHQPFRRRERAMIRFSCMRSLQKFVAVHASVRNHFNQDRTDNAPHNALN